MQSDRNEATPGIEVHHLVKHYTGAKVNAVDDVSFTVKRGEIFGLLGPNGAGKTTTIGILTTAVVPTSGQALITGIDIAKEPMRVKQRIAVVPQQSNLDRSLRAKEILTFHASYHGISKAEREQKAAELLDALGLKGRENDPVRKYSGGMAQRLMLARALMHSPDVLVLDEPTNNMDPQSRLFLWDRIRTLNAEGVTILLTTHDMDEAEQLCQRIAIMDRGKILVLDTPSELKKAVPGATQLELRVRLHAPETRELLATSLAQLTDKTLGEEMKVIQTAEPDVALYLLYTANAAAHIATATKVISEAGAELLDLRIAKPSLEDVFIYLTGKNLR